MEYNAIIFLEGLFEPTMSLDPDDLPGDWRCVFEERAAMREFHGEQLPRELAEAKALDETVRMMRVSDLIMLLMG